MSRSEFPKDRILSVLRAHVLVPQIVDSSELEPQVKEEQPSGRPLMLLRRTSSTFPAPHVVDQCTGVEVPVPHVPGISTHLTATPLDCTLGRIVVVNRLSCCG